MGLRGKKSTPSVCWDVLLKCQRLERRRSKGTPVVGEHLQGTSSSITLFLF